MPLDNERSEWIARYDPIRGIVGSGIDELMGDEVRAVKEQHKYCGKASKMVECGNVSKISTLHTACNRLKQGIMKHTNLARYLLKYAVE